MTVDDDKITLTISLKAAKDLVADSSIIDAATMVELEYAALAALGMDE